MTSGKCAAWAHWRIGIMTKYLRTGAVRASPPVHCGRQILVVPDILMWTPGDVSEFLHHDAVYPSVTFFWIYCESVTAVKYLNALALVLLLLYVNTSFWSNEMHCSLRLQWCHNTTTFLPTWNLLCNPLRGTKLVEPSNWWLPGIAVPMDVYHLSHLQMGSLWISAFPASFDCLIGRTAWLFPFHILAVWNLTHFYSPLDHSPWNSTCLVNFYPENSQVTFMCCTRTWNSCLWMNCWAISLNFLFVLHLIPSWSLSCYNKEVQISHITEEGRSYFNIWGKTWLTLNCKFINFYWLTWHSAWTRYDTTFNGD